MSYNNDRLDSRKDRKDSKINISLELESTGTPKILQKEEVNGICINHNNVCDCRG